MYGRHLLDASLINTLHASYPQLEVGVHGVLHQHGHVCSLETVGQSLHGKGVGGSTRAYPQDVHSILQAQLHVLRRGHLCGDEHSRLLLDGLQPWQRLLSVALEAAWLGAWLPHSSPEHVASL